MRARMAQMQDGSDTATETAAADNQPLTVEGQTEKVKTASLSHALITRLIAQFSTQGTAGTAASTDFSA